jgi:exopolysaccharide production protein ExoQ
MVSHMLDQLEASAAGPHGFPELPRPGSAAHRLSRQASLLRLCAAKLTLIALSVLLIGNHPFDAPDKLAIARSGNLGSELAMVAFALISALLLVARPRQALLVVRRNFIVVLMLVWLFATAMWAPYPDLTMRRASAYVLIYIIAIASAVSLGHLRDFERALYWSFTVVVVLCLFVVIAMPKLDRSVLGATGIYPDKNTAGSMSLISVIVLGFAIIQGRGAGERIIAATMTAMAWLFLLSTNSKTTIGLAALFYVAMPFIGYTLWHSRAARLLGGLLVITVAALIIFHFGLLGLNLEWLELLILGDLTFTDRTYVWSAILYEVTLRPLCGYGFGSFWDTGQPLNPITAATPYDFFLPADQINTAHNGYLDTALQAGLIGLFLEVVILLRCVWLLYSIVSATRADASSRLIAMMLLSVLVALLLNNMLESILFRTGDPLGFLFLFIMVQAEYWRLQVSPPAAANLLASQGRRPR